MTASKPAADRPPMLTGPQTVRNAANRELYRGEPAVSFDEMESIGPWKTKRAGLHFLATLPF